MINFKSALKLNSFKKLDQSLSKYPVFESVNDSFIVIDHLKLVSLKSDKK